MRNVLFSKKIWLLVIMLIGVVALLLVFAGKTPLFVAKKCDQAFEKAALEEAAARLGDPDPNLLTPVVDRINKNCDVNKNVSYQYVFVNYYIKINDPAKAKQYLEKLRANYKPDRGYSPYLGSATLSPEQLQADIELTEKLTEERKKNVRTFRNEP